MSVLASFFIHLLHDFVIVVVVSAFVVVVVDVAAAVAKTKY